MMVSLHCLFIVNNVKITSKIQPYRLDEGNKGNDSLPIVGLCDVTNNTTQRHDSFQTEDTSQRRDANDASCAPNLPSVSALLHLL